MSQSSPQPRSPRLLTLASLVIVVAALYFAKDVLIPLALSVMLAFLLAPLVNRIQRLGMGRVTAVIIVVAVVAINLALLGWLVYGQIGDLAAKLPSYRANIEEKVAWVRRAASGGPLEEASRVIQNSIEQSSTQPTSPQAPAPRLGADESPPTNTAQPLPVFVTNRDARPNPFKNFYQSFLPLLEPLGILGIVAILAIFMLIAKEDLRDRFIRLVGQGHINLTTQAMDEAATRVSRYLVAQCIVNGTYGLAIGLGLWLIGSLAGGGNPHFPNWFLWGLLTAVLRFIPYIGPWIGAAFPIAISLAVYPGMAVPLSVIGMFVVIEVLSNNAMEPWLYGTSAGVSTVAVLVAAVFWTWIWGTAGLLLATPLTVIIVVAGKYVPQLEFLNILLGDEPPLETRYRFYHRILAEDVESAEDMLIEIAAEQPLETVYDSVVLPAMGLAEGDGHGDRLDETKQVTFRQNVRELVEAMSELPPNAYAQSPSANRIAHDKARQRNGNRLADAVGPADEELKDAQATHYDREILCLPARDEADEIAGVMLTQVLGRKGYRAQYVSVDKLASEYIGAVERSGCEVVVISALPPGATAHARYIIKRLRARLPEIKIIVGLWTVCGEIPKTKQRLEAAGADCVVCSLAAAINELRQIVAPLSMRDMGGSARVQAVNPRSS